MGANQGTTNLRGIILKGDFDLNHTKVIKVGRADENTFIRILSIKYFLEQLLLNHGFYLELF